MVIGFFAPLPVPLMIPFMAVQSAAMMYQAGANWQFGKRKISAMTNEEFNPMTFNDLMIKNNADLVRAIPTMEQAIKQFTPLMSTIIHEFANYINEASKALPDFIQQATQSTVAGYQNMFQDFQNQLGNELKGLGNLIPSIPEAHADTGTGHTITDRPTSLSDFAKDETNPFFTWTLQELSLAYAKRSSMSTTKQKQITIAYQAKLKSIRDTGSQLPSIKTDLPPIGTQTDLQKDLQLFSNRLFELMSTLQSDKKKVLLHTGATRQKWVKIYTTNKKTLRNFLTRHRNKISQSNYKIRAMAQKEYTTLNQRFPFYQ